jgi:hypothetical protein
MGSYGASTGCAATGVPRQDRVLHILRALPAPSVLSVGLCGAGISCGGDQRHAVFEGEMCGVPEHTDSSVSDHKQVSETLCHMRLSVEDEVRCPKSGYHIDMLTTSAGGRGQWSLTGLGTSLRAGRQRVPPC